MEVAYTLKRKLGSKMIKTKANEPMMKATGVD